MSTIKNYLFNPKIKKNDIEKGRFVGMLPSWHQNQTLTNFLSSSVDHLFTPGNDIQLNGYIGDKPSWYNPVSDHYIPEISGIRSFYQLTTSMVSYDVSNDSYNSVLNYPDYIDSLKIQGSITDNESRLFSENFYTWCPSIDIDKFLNYKFYLWVSNNSNPSEPDYLTIDKNSIDKNPWSLTNNWVHIDDYVQNINETTSKAQRPIIEFFPNMELYNYGIYRRNDVNLISYDVSYTNISNQTSVEIDGIIVDEDYVNSHGGSIRILIINDKISSYNNKIYSLIFQNGKTLLGIDSDGKDTSGNPVIGEIIKITSGNSYSNSEFYWDGDSWSLAQKKVDKNQPPLFQLYDMDKISLLDQSKYPNSTFNGNKIFSYNDDGEIKDKVLDIPLTYDVYGQIQYLDFLTSNTYQYTSNLINYDIEGYYFYSIFDKDGNLEYINNWYESEKISKQYIIDYFTFDNTKYIFQLSQTPDYVDNIPDINISITGIDKQTSILEYNKDFIIFEDKVLIPNLVYNDTITIKSYSSKFPNENKSGYYELPINLTVNPNNYNLGLLSYGDVFDQFVDVLTGQEGYSGEYSSINNYRFTKKSPIYGKNIVQNKNNLLISMLLESNSDYNVVDSIEYSKNEYRKFRNKFEQKLTEYYKKGTLSQSSSYDLWVTSIIKDIIKGKTSSNSFFNNKMASLTDNEQNWFIPATPSFLGFYDIVVPEEITDYNSTGSLNYIKNHDNSLTLMFGDFRDNILLALENRIYNSINDSFKESSYNSKNYLSIYNEYSKEEVDSIIRPFFEKWCVRNNLNYRDNTTYNELNPYTWNWSNVISNIDGELLPGSYKGIYKKYFNTFTPHSTPWVMLGFNNKPSWWDSVYGEAPYTSNNKMMWRDISKGIIRSDNSTSNFTYPYLIQYLPVDQQGYLVDPNQCGIAKNYPNESDRKSEWKFTDCGPIEIVWRTSSEYGYSMAQTFYLCKPAKFIMETWNTKSNVDIMVGTISQQTINEDLKKRPSFGDYTVHNEFINDVYVSKIGSQQFISDFLSSKNKSITSFANTLRNLDVRLAHKVGGFTDKDQMSLTSDSSSVIPQENYKISLYKSPIIREEYYSGVMIKKDSYGYEIVGYNMDKPYFYINDLDYNSRYENIVIEERYNNQIHMWESKTYYKEGDSVINNGKYYVSKIDHTSSITFNNSFWNESTLPNISSKETYKWYSSNLDTTSYISYGTRYRTIQEVIDFLNGYQKYLSDHGWIFETIDDDENTVSDFKSYTNKFLKWTMDKSSLNQFISLSPLRYDIKFSTDIGNISNVIDSIRGSYGIIDKFGNSIPKENIVFTRGDGSLELTTNDNSEICGLRISIYEIEHILILDNKTIFNEVIYNPVFNVRQSRFKINGFKSGDWNGRFDAPGFIISSSSITPNFERSADSFRKFYDLEYSFDNKLQERAWANSGFSENSDLTSLSMSLSNQFEFYMGSIQNKGTDIVFDRLMNSNYITNDNNIKFYEEWLFRNSDYGNNDDKMMNFRLSSSMIKNNPQVIEFNSDEFEVNGIFSETIILDSSDTSKIISLENNIILKSLSLNLLTSNLEVSILDNDGNYLIKGFDNSNSNIINFDGNSRIDNITLDYSILGGSSTTIKLDIEYTRTLPEHNVSTDNVITLNDIVSSSSDEILSKDSKWNWRLFGKEVDFGNYLDDNYEYFPNAGYVNIDTVDYHSFGMDEFDTLYFEERNNNTEVASIVQTTTFDISQFDTSNKIINKLVDTKTSGYYIVKKIEVEVIKPFNVPVTINIGRKDQLPEVSTYSDDIISRITYEDLQTVGVKDYYPSSLWDSANFVDNSIDIEYDFSTSKITRTDDNSIDIENDVINGKLVRLSSVDSTGIVKITVYVDVIESGIIPNKRIWLYENTYGDWETYKINYDGVDVDSILEPSYTDQGSVVVLKNIIHNLNKVPVISISDGIIIGDYDVLPMISISDGVIIGDYDVLPMISISDGIIYTKAMSTVSISSGTIKTLMSSTFISNKMLDVSNNKTFSIFEYLTLIDNKPIIIDNVQNITPDISSNLYPKVSNSLSVDIDYNTSKLKVLKMYTDAGMNITSMVLNVTESFVAGNNETLGFNIGTDTNSTQLSQSSSIYNPTPTQPDLSINEPIELSIANSNINVLSDGYQVSVDVLRSGNIFNLPNTCSPMGITSVDWIVYPVDSQNNLLDSDGNITQDKNIIQNGTLVYSNPDDDNTVQQDYWDQKALVDIVSTFDYLKFEISNPVNASLSDKTSTTIMIMKNSGNSSENYLNPEIPGKSILDIGYYNLNNSNEYIIVDVLNAIKGRATLTIEYTFLNGFELYKVDNSPFIVSDEGNGGNIYRYISTRYDTEKFDVSLFNNGDIIEVDDYNNTNKWAIVQCNNNSLDILWTQQDKIDQKQLMSTKLYKDDLIEYDLNSWDPYKGIFPDLISNNIDYISNTDPSNYNNYSSVIKNNDNIIWGDDYVGKIWWDTSKLKYLDYENISNEYKSKYWGSHLPKSSIDVYEWVKSPVSPIEWNSYVEKSTVPDGFDSNPSGTVDSDIGDYNWVEYQTFNLVSNQLQTVYYFWVKNSNTIPKESKRDISCYGLSNMITNPINEGISYSAIIGDKDIIIGGISDLVNNEDFNVKIIWNSKYDNSINHKEWSLLRNNDPQNFISNDLWNNMSNSLLGYTSKSYTDKKKYIVSSNSNIGDNKIYVEGDLSKIKNYGVINIGNQWYNYEYISNNTLFLSENLTSNIVKGEIIIFDVSISNDMMIPDRNLTSFESNGNLQSPRQSWFPVDGDISSRYARKIFVQKFNQIANSIQILDVWDNWELLFNSSETEPTELEYSYRTDSMDYIESIKESNILKIGQRILYVDSSEYHGFWILYEYNPYISKFDNGLVVVRTQTWRMQDGEFWESIDWYKDGFSVDDFPIYVYEDKDSMLKDTANIDMTLLNGTLIKINSQNSNDTRWSWYIYNESGWTEVAKEKSTIRLLPSFYENEYSYGYGNNNDLSKIPYRDGTKELSWLLSNLKDSYLSNIDRLDIFFTMVKLSISLNKEIDWAIKSSFMYISGYNENLIQQPVSFVSHMDNIISYVDTIKPYHTKVRDYVNSIAYGPDICSLKITDFDFPVYVDTSTGSNRILNPVVQSPLNHNTTGTVQDTNIVKSSSKWNDWYSNYLNKNYDVSNWDKNWNPVRKKIITIKFDRVDSYSEDEIENLKPDLKKFYDFRGTVIKSPSFINADWDEFPWDYYSAWDSELDTFTGDEDYNSPTDTKVNIQPTGDNKVYSIDNERRDFDILGNDNFNDEYNPESIEVNGNKLVQPNIDYNRPPEIIYTGIVDTLIVRSTQIDKSNKIVQSYSFSKDNINTWEYLDLTKGFGSLIKDEETSISINTNGIQFHDPENPSNEFLEKVKLSLVDKKYTQEQIDSILGKKFPGVVYINNERILYWSIEKNQGNDISLKNLIRDSNGMVKNKEPSLGDKVYDGSILAWATDINLNMIQNKKDTPIISFNMDNTNKMYKIGNLNVCKMKD